MIEAEMRHYPYRLLGKDAYGQDTPGEEPQGTVKMAVFLNAQAISDAALYSTSEYIGMTRDKTVTDRHVIEHPDGLLKVLYVRKAGPWTEAFMVRL